MAIDNRLQVFNEEGQSVDYDILASDVKFLPDGKDLPTKLAEMETHQGDGTVKGVKVGSNTYEPTEGVVDLSTPFSGKVDKVDGKGLSKNDYTDADKAKVDNLKTVATSGSYNDLTDKPAIPEGATPDQSLDPNSDNAVSNAAVCDGLSTKANSSEVVKSISVNGTPQTKDGNGNVNVSVPTLTFDNAPTAGSNNPVKSGGIKTALDNLLTNLRIVNNEWYIGNTATGVSAQGPAGNVNITDASDLVTILVNDLTTGGGDNILSAEMGKILKVAITTLIDSMGEYCFPNGRPTLSFETPKWDVVQNLTNVNTDFHALRIDKDGELTIHLTAKSGYTIGSVVVMMGNVDVTTTYYTESTGTIHIPQVTDNVEITAIGDNIIYSLGYAKPENLVFMLDGLSQGDNANAWTDIINGVVFTPHGATKAAKGWSFDGNDDYMDGDSNMGDFDPYTHTIEVCINSGLTNTNYFVFVDSGGYMVVNYLYNYQNHDYYVFRGTAYTDSHSTKNGALSLGSNVRDNGNGVKILSYNGNVQDQQGGRINGEIKSAESLSNSSASGYPTVGARYKVSSSEYVDFFKGTIYAIRIYNTKLTLAEILANQKKDNERFELGLTLPNS